MAIIDRSQRAGRLPEIGEVDARECGSTVRRRDAIQVDDVVVVRQQLIDHCSAELAAAAGHCDAHTPGHHTGANQAPRRNARTSRRVVDPDAGWSLAG